MSSKCENAAAELINILTPTQEHTNETGTVFYMTVPIISENHVWEDKTTEPNAAAKTIQIRRQSFDKSTMVNNTRSALVAVLDAIPRSTAVDGFGLEPEVFARYKTLVAHYANQDARVLAERHNLLLYPVSHPSMLSLSILSEHDIDGAARGDNFRAKVFHIGDEHFVTIDDDDCDSCLKLITY